MPGCANSMTRGNAASDRVQVVSPSERLKSDGFLVVERKAGTCT